MTVHFNPRQAGVRDPFSAYMTDPVSLEIVRQVATEMGWPHERLHEGGLRSAAQGLAITPSPSILFVDLSDAAQPLTDIDALAEVCEPGTIVVACGPINDVGFYRALVGSGIHDYLPKPFDADDLRGALTEAQNALAAARGAETQVARPHLSVAIMGVRGGVGATTVATSIAWLLGQSTSRSTALLDLDIHFGTGALTLDLEPGRGLTDAIENPGRIDGLFLERAMVRANQTLSVLSAEAPMSQPLPPDATAFFQLQEELRQSFDATVVDLPRQMMVQHPSLLRDVNVAVVVTELGLAATRDTIRMLAWLKANAPRVTALVAVNRMVAGGQPGEIGRKDFEASIERPIDLVLPLDQKLSVQAAKLGKPLVEVAKGSKLGQALNDLTARVVSASGEEGAVAAAKVSLLGRLNELKTLLPKKAK
ncbi:MAG: pilus assembly protein CpaE [Sphingomonas fennica]